MLSSLQKNLLRVTWLGQSWEFHCNALIIYPKDLFLKHYYFLFLQESYNPKNALFVCFTHRYINKYIYICFLYLVMEKEQFKMVVLLYIERRDDSEQPILFGWSNGILDVTKHTHAYTHTHPYIYIYFSFKNVWDNF